MFSVCDTMTLCVPILEVHFGTLKNSAISIQSYKQCQNIL